MKILVLVALLQRPGFPVNQAGLNIFCYYSSGIFLFGEKSQNAFLPFSFKPLRKIQIRSRTFQIQA